MDRKLTLLPVTFLVLSAISGADAGCRYTNPEWEMDETKRALTAPVVQVAVTASEIKLAAKWNASLISAYPQCVDKINLFAGDDVMLCSTNLTSETCESSELALDSCKSEEPLQLWLTLVNEDHKDGPQHIRSPVTTQIRGLCSGDPKVGIEASESCEAIVPVWKTEPTPAFLPGRRGLRYININWQNGNLEGFECIDSFEIKYWPRGEASRSFVTSAITAESKTDQNHNYSSMLEVDECEEYTYIIRAAKTSPSVVVNHQGTFNSKCKGDNNEPSSAQQTSKQSTTTTTESTTITTTSTTVTPEEMSTEEEEEATTTTPSTTTTATTTTTASTTVMTTTSFVSTETTRLDAMLFKENVPSETSTQEYISSSEQEEKDRLEALLFKQGNSSTEKPSEQRITESTSNVPTTSSTMESYGGSLQNDQQMESARNDTDEEERKYLSIAIGIPAGNNEETDTGEKRSLEYEDEGAPTDFDELLARTQQETNVYKNARALQFDEYNSGHSTYPGEATLMALACLFILFL